MAWRPATPATQPARRAWREQCGVISALALTAVLLNGVTTADPLFKSIARGYWPVGGMDLMLLATSALAAWTWHRLGRPLSQRAQHHAGPSIGRTVGEEGVHGA